MKIAGQRRGETYPQAVGAGNTGGGFLVRGGSDNSISNVTYPTGDPTTPLLVQPGGDPLSVPLTGFTPGNMIVVNLSITMQNPNFEPTDYLAEFSFKIDIGAGARVVTGVPVFQTPVIDAPRGSLSWTFSIVPVAAEVTAAPVVTCFVTSNGVDDFVALGYGVQFSAYEADISKVTKVPTNFLAP